MNTLEATNNLSFYYPFEQGGNIGKKSGKRCIWKNIYDVVNHYLTLVERQKSNH